MPYYCVKTTHTVPWLERGAAQQVGASCDLALATRPHTLLRCSTQPVCRICAHAVTHAVTTLHKPRTTRAHVLRATGRVHQTILLSIMYVAGPASESHCHSVHWNSCH